MVGPVGASRPKISGALPRRTARQPVPDSVQPPKSWPALKSPRASQSFGPHNCGAKTAPCSNNGLFRLRLERESLHSTPRQHPRGSFHPGTGSVTRKRLPSSFCAPFIERAISVAESGAGESRGTLSSRWQQQRDGCFGPRGARSRD